jgi:hypothetical protein
MSYVTQACAVRVTLKREYHCSTASLVGSLVKGMETVMVSETSFPHVVETRP